MIKRALLGASALFFLLFALLGLFAAGRTKAYAATQSLAECVIEVNSRRLLFEKNAETNLPMASTTKVLTAIIIIDDCDLSEEVIIPEEAAGTEGSSVYLHAGDVYTVEELLYGLMLRSGNDCAETLALHHSGSIEAFAQVMNERAASMGAEHSRFVNPHGLPDKRHYTTARDLALVSAYAMENETFRTIVSCKYFAPRGWENKNKMLYQYDGSTGVKTGFTLSAGRCLVTAAERQGMHVVSVVLNSPQMYERTAQLLDDAFENYRLVLLCDSTKTYDGLRALADFSYPLTQEEEESAELRIQKISPLPQEEGEFAGQLQIYVKNSLLFSQNLYMMKG